LLCDYDERKDRIILYSMMFLLVGISTFFSNIVQVIYE